MNARYFLVPISHGTIRSIIYISGNKFVSIPLNGQINTFTLNFVIYFGAGHFLFILVRCGFVFCIVFVYAFECILKSPFYYIIHMNVLNARDNTQKRKNQLLFEFSWILICNRFSTLLAFITFAFYGCVCGVCVLVLLWFRMGGCVGGFFLFFSFPLFVRSEKGSGCEYQINFMPVTFVSSVVTLT